MAVFLKGLLLQHLIAKEVGVPLEEVEKILCMGETIDHVRS